MSYLSLNPRHLNGQKTPLRERLASLRYLPALIRMVWQINPWFTSAIVILRLARTLVPIGTLYVGKLIIDAVISIREGNQSLSALWKLVLLEVAIVVGGQILARCSSLIEGLLGQRFSNHTSIRLMEHASRLDIRHFENSAFYDRLERARRQTSNRLGLITQLLQVCQDVLTLASLSIALLVYSPWLVLLLAVAVTPSIFGESHFAILEYSLFHARTPERRKLEYLLYMGASDKTAKEVQLFGLARWIVSRYRRLSDRFYRENRRLSIRKNTVSAAFSLISVAAYYTAYAIILLRAVDGEISIGTLTFLAGSFERSNDLMQRLLIGASGIFEQALYLKDLFDFFDMEPSITSRPGAPLVHRPIREGFVFEDVGFRYEGSDNWAVRHLSFCIRPGERVALVGENGAGKTTVTKLIARLYDVTEGRILLDGKDIREYDVPSLRRAIGVIFQDFVRYDLRFAENIGVGEIEEVHAYLDLMEEGAGPLARAGDSRQPNDPPAVPASIVSAAEKSLASALLARLPDRYFQMLGKRFDKGAELSGGEWQKIALARAYMRDAQLLILDEPTAALDARAEYEVFARFSRLVSGRMAVIISHRFSTVRMADRIIVLRDGMLVEDGSHDQLVRDKGLYSELFALQAAGYR
ncbi:MAG TPA: ABC transporter ATP-binding protein [Blastocatellia bacterium]|nr:ABC transporter ATP-binding protein [Blastocatellia bacterium]